MAVPVRQRVVEIEADLGEDNDPRYRYGSGLLVGGRTVLTAAHAVIDTVAVTVRRSDKLPWSAELDGALIGDADRLDLALLDVPDLEEPFPSLRVATVDRDTSSGDQVVEGCWSVGYPLFQEVERDADGRAVRETAHVHGQIPPLSGLVEKLLSLEVKKAPRDLPESRVTLGESQWSGMSGAAVLAGDDVLVGVVAEHARRRGSSDITVTPLDFLYDPDRAPANAAQWRERLGVSDPSSLVRLPAKRAEIGNVGPSVIIQQSHDHSLNVSVMAQPEPLTALFQLPAEPVVVGRRSELARIVEVSDSARAAGRGAVVSITGMGGVGKSALAVHAAHQMAPHYPDAQLYIQFTPDTNVVAALSHLLLSFGVARDALPQDLPAALALYRSRCSGFRMLLLLDNVGDADDLQLLLPGSEHAIVLTTSRSPLEWTADAVPVPLTALDTESSLALLCGVAGRDAAREDRTVLEDIVALCAGLPLAVRIVAARWRTVPHWPAHDLLSRLRSADDALGAIDADHHAVSASLQLSWDELADEEAQALSRLSVAPWSHVSDMFMFRLLGLPDLHDADVVLDRLCHVQLLEPLGAGRYRLHDLVREFARRRLADTRAFRRGIIAYFVLRQGAIEVAIDKHYAPLAEVESERNDPNIGFALEDERDNLPMDLRLANDQGLFELTIWLAPSIAEFLMLTGDVEGLQRTADLTAAAVEGKQRPDRPFSDAEITAGELATSALVCAMASRVRGAPRDPASLRQRARDAQERDEPALAAALWFEIAAHGIDERDRSVWEPAVRAGADASDDPRWRLRLHDLAALGTILAGDYVVGERLLSSIVASLRDRDASSVAAREYAEALLHWSVALRLTGQWKEALETCIESRNIWMKLQRVARSQLDLATCSLELARIFLTLKQGRYVADDLAALETFFRERGFVVPQLIALRGLVAARRRVLSRAHRIDKRRLQELEADVQRRTHAYPHTSPWSAVLLGDLGTEKWTPGAAPASL